MLEAFREEMRQERREMREEMTRERRERREEMTRERREMRRGMQEMRRGMQEMRRGMREMRQEMREMRQEMRDTCIMTRKVIHPFNSTSQSLILFLLKKHFNFAQGSGEGVILEIVPFQDGTMPPVSFCYHCQFFY